LEGWVWEAGDGEAEIHWGSLPLAVQWLGLPEGDHGGLLRGPAQGLGMARVCWGVPLGSWQGVVGRRPTPLPGCVAAVGGPAPGSGAFWLGFGLRGIHVIGLWPPPGKKNFVTQKALTYQQVGLLPGRGLAALSTLGCFPG
jgi:hypothetical protein